MIEKLTLKNFQSHRKTKLEFDPGVNVVIGPSDCGKTAIIRALRWLIWNRPLGNSFISHWSESAQVAIEIDGGKVITRIKNSTGINHYKMGDLGFDAVKTDVPQEIIEALNMEEVNIQQQLDRPFLLDATSGEVAQHFNKVAHLDVIDTATKQVQKWIRQIQQSIATKEEIKQGAETTLEQYKYLDVVEYRISALETAQQQLAWLKTNRKLLEELLKQIQSTDQEISTYQQLPPMEKKVSNILGKMQIVKDRQSDFRAVDGVIKQCNHLDDEIHTLKELLTAEPLILMILDDTTTINILKKQKTELETILNQIKTTEIGIDRRKATILISTEQFQKEFPDICPLCGQVVKKKGVK